jgi:hypothetical protein
MKKVYLSMMLLGLGCTVSFAQKMPKALTSSDVVRTMPKPTQQHPSEKQLGVTFWQNNFDTPSEWTIDNSGQTGAEFGWTVDATSDGWYAANGINSTSGGNYAELSNGDPTLTTPNQALNVIYNITTAQPIDISANGTNISLSFEQFGARFNDLQEIQISTNGSTFITVGDNMDKPVLSSAGGSAYANPDLKSINLAPFIGGSGATQLWIRFTWTTAYPSSASNPNVWITYGWYIDDVKLTTNAEYDLELQSNYWGTAFLNYYQIPLTQVAPIDFSANVFNGGTLPMTNTKLNVDINSGAFVASSASTTVPSLSTDSLFITTQFTPNNSATATYNVTRTITSDNPDDIPSNNSFAPISFSTTNFIYARDNNNTTNSGSTSNGADGFEAGNLFDIWADQTLTSIVVKLAGGANGTALGTEIFAKVYSIDPNTGDFVYEGESDPYIVAAGNTNINLNLPLNAPVNLIANNTYLAVVGSFGTGLKISNAGTSDPQTSFFLDMLDGTWYYQTGTPYVRMNFDPSGSIEENAVQSVQVYPNPTTNETKISYDLINASEVTVQITDLSGKEVFAFVAGQQQSGSHEINLDMAAYNSGVYYVTLTTADQTVTKKVIKK